MTNDELKAILDTGFHGTHSRLDAINGRTRQNEIAIAILQDRSDRSERQSGIIGAISGGMASGIILAIKALFGR